MIISMNSSLFAEPTPPTCRQVSVELWTSHGDVTIISPTIISKKNLEFHPSGAFLVYTKTIIQG